MPDFKKLRIVAALRRGKTSAVRNVAAQIGIPTVSITLTPLHLADILGTPSVQK